MPTRIVDLTLTLKDGLRTWDIKPPFTLLPYMNASTFKLGFSTKLLVMEDHTGGIRKDCHGTEPIVRA